MTYLALGDSISIDLYTEVAGGGAASQLAQLLKADSFLNLTRDGTVSEQVLRDLRQGWQMPNRPIIDAVTLTLGGNDLLSGHFSRQAGGRGDGAISFETFSQNFKEIAEILARLKCPVVMNTIYDPTDGDDKKAAELGLVAEARQGLTVANAFIRRTAQFHGFLLCDLETLFHGHGFWSSDPWIVFQIEPSHLGATKIAEAWHDLIRTSLPSWGER
ncbi:SGNH/GDSL hydrolase family protein [bacterium]|nr:MAG: SGNH/GDSL hydrolase family protein [bacterium]